MKYLFILMSVFFQTTTGAQTKNQARTDREMQTMEKMYNLQKEEEKEELEAQQQIFNFKNETSEIIRANRTKITNEEYSNLDALQILLWNQISERKKNYSSSKKFLSYEYNSLNNYKENVLNRLYQYINNNENPSESKDDDELNKWINEYQKLFKYTQDLKSQNESLSNQNQLLKNENAKLIESSKESTAMIIKATENLEKSLEYLKNKDLKILELQEALSKNNNIPQGTIKKQEK